MVGAREHGAPRRCDGLRGSRGTSRAKRSAPGDGPAHLSTQQPELKVGTSFPEHCSAQGRPTP